MARYVDGFVVPVPKKNLAEYVRVARKAGKVWIEHGALSYLECQGDDLGPKFGLPFPKLAKLKPNETVFYSFIVYKSRRHRDQVNRKVMADPRLSEMMDKDNMPFDMKRMSYGGFKGVVDLGA
jgi:uncharacterized protein YbaA (DUF1428 family)